MTSELALLPGRRTVRRWDLMALATMVALGVLGTLTVLRVRALGGLGGSLLDVAATLDATAEAVSFLDGVPIVGDGAGGLASSVSATADEIRNGVAVAQADLGVLAVLAGLAVTVLPALPLLLVYLPLRLARLRELRALRAHLRGLIDPLLVEHLARSALRRVPYAALRRISPTPWADVERGHHLPLAAAELRRLGVDPPADWPVPGADHSGG
jgi:hypothetical protein